MDQRLSTELRSFQAGVTPGHPPFVDRDFPLPETMHFGGFHRHGTQKNGWCFCVWENPKEQPTFQEPPHGSYSGVRLTALGSG